MNILKLPSIVTSKLELGCFFLYTIAHLYASSAYVRNIVSVDTGYYERSEIILIHREMAVSLAEKDILCRYH